MKASVFSQVKSFIVKHKILISCLVLVFYFFFMLMSLLAPKPSYVEVPGLALKDPYGRSYLIGNLGGRPVRVLASVVIGIFEYEDSPFFDLDKKKRIKLSERTYDSEISAFGFRIRYTDGVYYDLLNKEAFCQFKKEYNQPGNAWVRVGVENATGFYDPHHVLDRYLDGDLESYPNKSEKWVYKKLPESQFGMEVYAVPGIDPKTGIPWRQEGDDIFIFRNQYDEVDTFIECSNRNVPRPPCSHKFMILQEDMKVKISLLYNRQILPHWREIQAAAKEAVLRFDIRNPIDSVWAQQQNISKSCIQQ
ncbi:hypothetical protein [Stenoxybacter acetivorans]|uniref:hypothetical protein n=1 Tax=Stenoxybacter acetivorans TaxID=422441 RepID=UPI00068944DB|nr:hypothetical protein [Stenoxybacter acetivorans]